MSHFAVAVFTEPNGKTVEELLAPYDENIEYEPYIQYTKEQAIAKVRKEIEDYKNGTYAKYLADPEKYEAEHTNKNHIDYLKNEFPKRLAWTDEECYQHEAQFYDYDDGDSMIDEDGNLLSTYNPNSKWDWYVIGGRFSGGLKAKNGEHGEDSAFNANPRVDGEFDSARVGDIDFSMDMDEYNKAIRYWEVVVEKQPLKDGEKEDDFCNWYRDGYYEEYYRDKETYAKICASCNTYAVVTPDGTWHEKGSMGWWGTSSETGDESLDWDLHYKERFIDTADPDWTLTIVDCHI